MFFRRLSIAPLMSLTPLVAEPLKRSTSRRLLERANSVALKSPKGWNRNLEVWLSITIGLLCGSYSLVCVEAAAARSAVGPGRQCPLPATSPTPDARYHPSCLESNSIL